MDTISILAWLVGISLILLRFISGKKHDYITYYLSALVLYALAVLVVDTFLGTAKVSHFWEKYPVDIQLLLLLLSVLTISDLINKHKFEQFEGDTYPIILGFIGVAYITGSIFFGYHHSQIITGITLAALGILFFITNRNTSSVLFYLLTLVGVAFIFADFLLVTYLIEKPMTIDNVADIVLRDGAFIVILIYFLLVNMRRHGILDEDKTKLLSKVCLVFVCSGFLVRHPEVNISKIPIVKDYIKYAAVSGDLGTIAYCSVLVARKAVFNV